MPTGTLLHGTAIGLDAPLPISVAPAYTASLDSPTADEPVACTVMLAGAENELPLDGQVTAATGTGIAGLTTVTENGADRAVAPEASVTIAVNV